MEYLVKSEFAELFDFELENTEWFQVAQVSFL